MSKGHSLFSKTTRVLAKLLIFGVILGSYTNASVFATAGNNVSYTMEFSENTVENMPANILDGFSPDTQAIIPSGTANTPTRPSYKFAGWCDQPTTKNGKSDTCASGHSYQPGETYPLSSTTGSANKIKLYAMWQEVSYLQNLTADKCTTAMSTAIDSRDGTEYHIQRLADGKCWLLDNLALDLTNPTVLNGMNENNTHASNTTLSYLKGTTTRDPSTDPDGQYATAKVSNWTSGYSFSAPLVNMDSKNLPTSGDTNISGVDTTSWKYGGYYNYCAASAGSYCYGNGTDFGTSSGNATEDICPAGWRMPGGSDTVNLTATPPTGEYQNLYNNSSYNTYANYRSALRLPLSSYFFNGSARDQGKYGGWWSSTRFSSNNYYMYTLNANTSIIYPVNNYARDFGVSVRCVLGS